LVVEYRLYLISYSGNFQTDSFIDKESMEIRYDTIVEFNLDSKAEYSALSSTRRNDKSIKGKKVRKELRYRY